MKMDSKEPAKVAGLEGDELGRKSQPRGAVNA